MPRMDPWGWYIWMGSMLPYIAAPWIRHGMKVWWDSGGILVTQWRCSTSCPQCFTIHGDWIMKDGLWWVYHIPYTISYIIYYNISYCINLYNMMITYMVYPYNMYKMPYIHMININWVLFGSKGPSYPEHFWRRLFGWNATTSAVEAMARRLPWILDDFWLTKDFNGPRGTVIEMGQHTGHPQVLRISPMLTPGWEPEGPAQKNSQGVPWIFLDISTAFFIPAAVFYMLGLCRNFIRRLPLLSNIKVLHALDSQSHGILARRDFGTWNSSNRDFGRSVWMALCAIGFQIHRANASHVLELSRNCTLPCICCPGPVFGTGKENEVCASIVFLREPSCWKIHVAASIVEKSQAHGIWFNCYFQKPQIFGILTHGLAGGS